MLDIFRYYFISTLVLLILLANSTFRQSNKQTHRQTVIDVFLQRRRKDVQPPLASVRCSVLNVTLFLVQVRKFDLSNSKLTEDDVIIMASDGLWERLSSEKVLKWTAGHTNQRYLNIF